MKSWTRFNSSQKYGTVISASEPSNPDLEDSSPNLLYDALASDESRHTEFSYRSFIGLENMEAIFWRIWTLSGLDLEDSN